jgi:hypothetical protein
MIEFKKTTQEDLDYVRLNPYEDAVKNYPYMVAPDDNCYTVIYEGSLVAVGGLCVRWEGVGLLWLILTSDCKKYGIHGVVALLAIKEKVNELIENNSLWRAEADVRVDFPQAIKMIEYLGFTRECRREQYFPDKTDGYLYSKVIK